MRRALVNFGRRGALTPLPPLPEGEGGISHPSPSGRGTGGEGQRRAGLLPTIFFAYAVPCALALAVFASPARADEVIRFTREDIARLKVNRVADVLNQAPGVSAGDSSVTIHGSTKVKVLVDGRPINDPGSSYGAVNWSVVSLESIKRIEILPGQGGVRYGQDAAGGVILISTGGGGSFSGQVKVWGGNHDSWFADAQAQAKSGNWSVEGGAQARGTHSYTENNDYTRSRGGLGLGYGPDERHHLNLRADRLHENIGSPGQPAWPTPHSRKKGDSTLLSARLVYEDLNLATFFNGSDEHRRDFSRNLDQKLEVEEYGQDINWTLRTGSWGSLALGASGRLNQGEGSDFARTREKNGALFAAQTFSRKDSPWILTLGARAFGSDTFDSGLNPEIRLEYKKPVWSLALGYNRSNNLPTLRQRYGRSSSTVPNPDLGMETADNWLAALSLTPSKRFSLRFSLFDNRIEDRITYQSMGRGMGQYVNYGSVRYRGGDCSLNWQPLDSLTFKANYIYLDAENRETGRKLPAKASHVLRGDISWQATDKLLAVLSGKHSSKVYLDSANKEEVDGYTLLDLRAEYDFGDIALFAEINNLANSTWLYADGLLGPPRTWLVGLRYRW